MKITDDKIETATNSPHLMIMENMSSVTYKAKIDTNNLCLKSQLLLTSTIVEEFDAKATYISGSGTSISSSEAGVQTIIV